MMSLVSAPTDSRSGRDGSLASPPAARNRAVGWRDPKLVAGIVVVAACGLLGALLLGRPDDTVALWAAARPIAVGDQVTAADLVRDEVRFDDPHDADRYLRADALVPEGATVRRAVGPGELVPRDALGGKAADALTEVPLSVVADALPVTVRVGSVVDVWVTPDRARLAAAARPDDSELVFDDVAVVSVGRSGGTLGPSATRQVIVGVRPDLVRRLPSALSALSSGSVILTRQR
jgi:hypothetical protein